MRLLDVTFASESEKWEGCIDLDEVATAHEWRPSWRDAPGTVVMMKACGHCDDFVLTPWREFREAWHGPNAE